MGGFLRQLFNVPNGLSLFRLAVAPLVMVFWIVLEWRVAALALGALAGITDLFDGIVARKLNQVTEIGALIDQVGDLVFESFCLILAILTGELWLGWLLIYLFREFTISAMRAWVMGRGGSLPTSNVGKTKSSLLQYAYFSFFLGVILIQPGTVPESWILAGLHPGRLLIWIATFAIAMGIGAGLLSGWSYARAFIGVYTSRNSSPPGAA
ncbi:MAG TPA: CDP-alcohol phosphatidyltransferase family protein [Polyangia bacterium]|nr:CDP-alcohol phosphatidyltransferase family protein [Polyangia bacterium]